MSSAPPALAWPTGNCTIGRTMAILGERWRFVVLHEVFNGVRRFDDIRRSSAGRGTGSPFEVSAAA